MRPAQDVNLVTLKASRDAANVFIVAGATWLAILIRGPKVTPTPRGRAGLIREFKRDVTADTPLDLIPAALWQYLEQFGKTGSWSDAASV